jgi:hypothetical protein
MNTIHLSNRPLLIAIQWFVVIARDVILGIPEPVRILPGFWRPITDVLAGIAILYVCETDFITSGKSPY